MVEEATWTTTTVMGGVCTVAVNATINVGNMEFLKIQLSYEESYTGNEGDTRQDRFNALLGAVKENLITAQNELMKTLKDAKPDNNSSEEGHRYIHYNKDF